MDLQERLYSVLLVSAAENFNIALTALLPEALYTPLHIVSSVSAAKRAIYERSFDYVIINAPLADEFGTRFAIDTCHTQGTIVLLLVKSELHAEIHDKVVKYGVFTLPKPISKTTVALALNWMASARERLRKFEKTTLSLEEKMEEIRVVNRAKWLLISELKMNEPDAHRYIGKQAMDRCISKREVAEEIIKTYL